MSTLANDIKNLMIQWNKSVSNLVATGISKDTAEKLVAISLNKEIQKRIT
jgi:hypothetical protein